MIFFNKKKWLYSKGVRDDVVGDVWAPLVSELDTW